MNERKRTNRRLDIRSPTKKTFNTDWREELVEFLISAGTEGRTKSAIIARLVNKVNAQQIEDELEVLHLEDKVQKFEVPTPSGHGRARMVWRATKNIMV